MEKITTLQGLKEYSPNLRNVTSWESIKENEIYHIPPLLTLDRRDIIILSKKNDQATYKRVDAKDDDKRMMHKTSLFAKFIVKRKKY